VRLVYASFDDGMVHRMNPASWKSASGVEHGRSRQIKSRCDLIDGFAGVVGRADDLESSPFACASGCGIARGRLDSMLAAVCGAQRQEPRRSRHLG
jgi:hypothetical protein